MPSFKTSLIVVEFQGNYLKTGFPRTVVDVKPDKIIHIRLIGS